MQIVLCLINSFLNNEIIMSFFLEQMMKTKNDNSKNINVTAFKEQLSITFFSNLVFKHENIRELID